MMENRVFALKGAVVYTEEKERFICHDNAYVVCENGVSAGVYRELPANYKDIQVMDYGSHVIIPGLCDLHLHAPQYGFRGLGRNIEADGWGTWFDIYAFPEESHYRDLEYAARAYERFTHDLMKTTTTRAVMFATIHRPATELLMSILYKKGFAAYVGKVNMDRNSMEGLVETTEESLRETEEWLRDCRGLYGPVKPVITPRYVPTCTNQLLEGLGALTEKYNVPVQSHLSEGLDEIKWVNELEPGLTCYGEAYDRYGLMGSAVPAVMAHCVFPNEAEMELMRERKVMVAHCPECNMFAANIAPVREYLDSGIAVGLGSDMAGVGRLEMFQVVKHAILASRVRWAQTERGDDPDAVMGGLSWSEAFYLATKGGGSFWGKAGSFEPGYLFDAVVLDDTSIADLSRRSTCERIERLIQAGDDRNIVAKYIEGRLVYGSGK